MSRVKAAINIVAAPSKATAPKASGVLINQSLPFSRLTQDRWIGERTARCVDALPHGASSVDEKGILPR
jgi:hypothetical protein